MSFQTDTDRSGQVDFAEFCELIHRMEVFFLERDELNKTLLQKKPAAATSTATATNTGIGGQ